MQHWVSMTTTACQRTRRRCQHAGWRNGYVKPMFVFQLWLFSGISMIKIDKLYFRASAINCPVSQVSFCPCGRVWCTSGKRLEQRSVDESWLHYNTWQRGSLLMTPRSSPREDECSQLPGDIRALASTFSSLCLSHAGGFIVVVFFFLYSVTLQNPPISRSWLHKLQAWNGKGQNWCFQLH